MQSRSAPFRCYLTQSVFKVVLQNSIPTQIHQLIPFIHNSEGQVDGFVGVLTSAKRLEKYFVRDKFAVVPHHPPETLNRDLET